MQKSRVAMILVILVALLASSMFGIFVGQTMETQAQDGSEPVPSPNAEQHQEQKVPGFWLWKPIQGHPRDAQLPDFGPASSNWITTHWLAGDRGPNRTGFTGKCIWGVGQPDDIVVLPYIGSDEIVLPLWDHGHGSSLVYDDEGHPLVIGHLTDRPLYESDFQVHHTYTSDETRAEQHPQFTLVSLDELERYQELASPATCWQHNMSTEFLD